MCVRRIFLNYSTFTEVEPAPPEAHVQPADPNHPIVFSLLPIEIWEHICSFVVDDLSADFLVTTAKAVSDDKSALAPFRFKRVTPHFNPNQHQGHADDDDSRADHVVSGVVCDGKLYMTKVPSDPHAFMGDPQAEGNGAWYSHIHRTEDGSIDYTRMLTPNNQLQEGHAFYKDTDGTLMLKASRDERDVVEERHRTDELQVVDASGYAHINTFKQRVMQRCHDILQDERFKYMPIRDARAEPQTGRLTIFALCKALQLRVKMRIEGIVPLLTRIKVYDPDDEIRTMTTPFNITNQMSFSHDKWLAIVPLKWAVAQQAFGDQCPATRQNFGVCAKVRRVLEMPIEQLQKGELIDNELPHQLLRLNEFGGYNHTSFGTIAPAMVYFFFANGFGKINLNSVPEMVSLLADAFENRLFQIEYNLTGRHVPPIKDGESLRAAGPRPPQLIVDSPEAGLFDGLPACVF